MGLLDSFDDPSTVGLLSLGAGLMNASGPSRTPVSIGRALGQGMQSGLEGYQQVQTLQLQRALQQQQIESQRTENLLHKAQADKLIKEMTKQRQIEDLAPQFYRDPQSAASVAMGQGAAEGDMGPTPGNAARLAAAQPQPGGFDQVGYMQALSKIDPLMAIKMAADARKAAQVTLKDGEQVYDGKTGQKLYGNDPAPNMSFIPGDGYRPDVVFDSRRGFVSAGQGLSSGRPASTQGAAATNSAPWSGMPAKQADEMRSKLYETEAKKLEALRQKVENGQAVMQDLERFGVLNRNTGTGGIQDRIGWLPSFTDDKREMEAITSRLAPNQRPVGSGSSSDRDVSLFLAGLPSIDKPGPVNANIRTQYTNELSRARAELAFKEAYLAKNGHLNGVEQAWAAQGAGKPAAPSSGGKVVVARGMYGGRPVVQYSDGSTAYAQ